MQPPVYGSKHLAVDGAACHAVTCLSESFRLQERRCQLNVGCFACYSTVYSMLQASLYASASHVRHVQGRSLQVLPMVACRVGCPFQMLSCCDFMILAELKLHASGLAQLSKQHRHLLVYPADSGCSATLRRALTILHQRVNYRTALQVCWVGLCQSTQRALCQVMPLALLSLPSSTPRSISACSSLSGCKEQQTALPLTGTPLPRLLAQVWHTALQLCHACMVHCVGVLQLLTDC